MAADPSRAPARTADWTLVPVAGAWWVALNQEGEIFATGNFGMCLECVRYWCRVSPPRGAAYGEHGRGSSRTLSELGRLEDDPDGR